MNKEEGEEESNGNDRRRVVDILDNSTDTDNNHEKEGKDPEKEDEVASKEKRFKIGSADTSSSLSSSEEDNELESSDSGLSNTTLAQSGGEYFFAFYFYTCLYKDIIL